MSHDRGCPCGREKMEYDDCDNNNCFKRQKDIDNQLNNPYKNPTVDLFRKSTNPFGHGDPAVEELVGNYPVEQALEIIDQNKHNYDYNYYTKTIQKVRQNTDKKFDALVFIGRFSPVHNGHCAVIDQAIKQAKDVVIVVGSSFAARNLRNPFTFEERKEMIKSVYPQDNVKVVPISDYPYDDNKWVKAVQEVVEEAAPDAKNIGLIGHNKDHTSYYLNIFPRWKNHVEVENYMGLNATDIRNNYLDETIEMFAYQVPQQVDFWLNRHYKTFDGVRTEFREVKRIKALWAGSPFPPTFNTVDSVIVQSGHVLLVERGGIIGNGLWAIPGGYLNQNETLLKGAIRELKEETGIKVPLPVLMGSIKESHTFDDPNRSQIGRVITQAFYIDLGMKGELPKVKGSDDAAKAFWVPFNELRQDKFFDDHYAILDYFLNIAE